jgi:hypothetical protein
MRKGLVRSGENWEDDRRCNSAELREGGTKNERKHKDCKR